MPSTQGLYDLSVFMGSSVKNTQLLVYAKAWGVSGCRIAASDDASHALAPFTLACTPNRLPSPCIASAPQRAKPPHTTCSLMNDDGARKQCRSSPDPSAQLRRTAVARPSPLPPRATQRLLPSNPRMPSSTCAPSAPTTLWCASPARKRKSTMFVPATSGQRRPRTSGASPSPSAPRSRATSRSRCKQHQGMGLMSSTSATWNCSSRQTKAGSRRLTWTSGTRRATPTSRSPTDSASCGAASSSPRARRNTPFTPRSPRPTSASSCGSTISGLSINGPH